MVVMGIFLVGTILWVGTLYWKLHSLPERMAHKTHKLQFEIVAVLGLIALFTHMHIFWIAGLLLALIDLPDFGNPLGRIAGSVERLAGIPPGQGAVGVPDDAAAADHVEHVSAEASSVPRATVQYAGIAEAPAHPELVAA